MIDAGTGGPPEDAPAADAPAVDAPDPGGAQDRPIVSETAGAEAAVPGGAPSGAVPPDGPVAVDRRSFVRSLAGESVTTAGKLAGISGMVTGSLVAAMRAAGDGLAALGGPTATTPAPARPVVPRPAPASTPAAPAAPPRISDADRATIETLTLGLLATNQPGAAPAVGIVRFWFDGDAFHIPARSATARIGNLQRDPFASLSLVDPETGEALLIAGRTRIVYRSEGRDGAAAALEACGVALGEGWDAPDSRGDPVLIVLEPQRLFRRGPDERP